MAKNLKFTIKNSQIAAAVNLSGLKEALQKKQEEPALPPAAPLTAEPTPAARRSAVKPKQPQPVELKEERPKEELAKEERPKDEKPRVKARTRSAFTGSESSASSAFEKDEAEVSPAAENKEPAKESVNEMSEQEEKSRLTASDLSQESTDQSASVHQGASISTVTSEPVKAAPSMQHESVLQEKSATPIYPAQILEPSTVSASAPEQVPSTPVIAASNETEKKFQSNASSASHAPSSASAHARNDTRSELRNDSRGAAPRPSYQRPGSSTPPPRPSSSNSTSSTSAPRSTPTTTDRYREPVDRYREPTLPAIPRPLVRNPSLFSAGRTPPPPIPGAPVREKLGPTGKHVRDLIPPPRPPRPAAPPPRPAAGFSRKEEAASSTAARPAARPAATTVARTTEDDAKKGGVKTGRLKEFQDVKPVRKGPSRGFDARDRQGLRSTDEDSVWRKRRNKMGRPVETVVTRPTSLHVRLPITVKDLASEMKIKASQVIEKIFLQGMVRTINDFLDDPTLVELIGHELGCQLTIDTTEEDRIRITGHSVREEVAAADSGKLTVRPPIVAFMGHVDHGKTSLIDAIRKTNRVAGEAGAITQHIGAFQCTTSVGSITVLDTPGHEAFSAMRARGADVTDIVVLVVAGDEGIRQQTLEAIEHAKAAKVTIVVAINKCDKPNFNAETVYRQLSEQELLPEAWGGSILTINCSATTGEGIPQLLEMLALQSEVLELRANPAERARGRVIESEMHKGMGPTATILVQNGTLHKGDSLVFDQHWGRVKTMHNDLGQPLTIAGPSAAVKITGLSGLPEAGQEFIVVPAEKEAREIAEKRMLGFQQNRLQQAKRISLESLTQQASDSERKMLNLILRADVQGSLEALQTSLKKIHSKKVGIQVIASGIGEISESDVQLAASSKVVILGFHTSVESHAESLIRQTGVQVRLHDIIYHAIDDIKLLMAGLLDRIAVETEKGKAEVLAIFHSSQMGLIAGCKVTEGAISRNCQLRLRRGKDVVWQGGLTSLKRAKEDVREVQKGFECGMVLQGCKDVQQGDIIEAYEITYITQEL